MDHDHQKLSKSFEVMGEAMGHLAIESAALSLYKEKACRHPWRSPLRFTIHGLPAPAELIDAEVV